jgi:hypothetical protein
VANEELGRELTVGVRRVGVEGATEPETVLLEGIHVLGVRRDFGAKNVTRSTA